jgi:hypothetical protein
MPSLLNPPVLRQSGRLTLLAVGLVGVAVGAQTGTYPRTLTATGKLEGAGGAVETTVTIHVERLMSDSDYESVANGLRYGGYPKFLDALRQLPVVGRLEVGQQKADLKYARVTTTEKGERLVVGADRPIYFLGAGRPGAKPKEGYETAFVQLEIDRQGQGSGTIAAAARVKPGGGGAVVVDDYADSPIRITLVR